MNQIDLVDVGVIISPILGLVWISTPSAPGGGITTNRPSARRTATAEFVVPTSKPTDGGAS